MAGNLDETNSTRKRLSGKNVESHSTFCLTPERAVHITAALTAFPPEFAQGLRSLGLLSKECFMRAQDTDRHVGLRMRERRVMLGLTQTQLAKWIGVTYQQAHKYEKGVNRIAAGRLHMIANALGVDVNYFFEGVNENPPRRQTLQQQQMQLELAKTFLEISSRPHQEAILALARALRSGDGEEE